MRSIVPLAAAIAVSVVAIVLTSAACSRRDERRAEVSGDAAAIGPSPRVAEEIVSNLPAGCGPIEATALQCVGSRPGGDATELQGLQGRIRRSCVDWSLDGGDPAAAHEACSKMDCGAYERCIVVRLLSGRHPRLMFGIPVCDEFAWKRLLDSMPPEGAAAPGRSPDLGAYDTEHLLRLWETDGKDCRDNYWRTGGNYEALYRRCETSSGQAFLGCMLDGEQELLLPSRRPMLPPPPACERHAAMQVSCLESDGDAGGARDPVELRQGVLDGCSRNPDDDAQLGRALDACSEQPCSAIERCVDEHVEAEQAAARSAAVKRSPSPWCRRLAQKVADCRPEASNTVSPPAREPDAWPGLDRFCNAWTGARPSLPSVVHRCADEPCDRFDRCLTESFDRLRDLEREIYWAPSVPDACRQFGARMSAVTLAEFAALAIDREAWIALDNARLDACGMFPKADGDFARAVGACDTSAGLAYVACVADTLARLSREQDQPSAR